MISYRRFVKKKMGPAAKSGRPEFREQENKTAAQRSGHRVVFRRIKAPAHQIAAQRSGCDLERTFRRNPAGIRALRGYSPFRRIKAPAHQIAAQRSGCDLERTFRRNPAGIRALRGYSPFRRIRTQDATGVSTAPRWRGPTSRTSCCKTRGGGNSCPSPSAGPGSRSRSSRRFSRSP